MEWARILAYITGTVDQELLLRNEYLAAENRILKAQLQGRLRLSNAERATLGEIGHRLGRKALGEVATAGLPDTILGWYRRLVARRFDGSRARRAPGRPPLGCGLNEAGHLFRSEGGHLFRREAGRHSETKPDEDSDLASTDRVDPTDRDRAGGLRVSQTPTVQDGPQRFGDSLEYIAPSPLENPERKRDAVSYTHLTLPTILLV